MNQRARVAVSMLVIGAILWTAGCAMAAPVVPTPYEPLDIEPQPEGSSGQVVRPWGRAYEFERGPLPEQIISQGVPLFSAAPRLEVSISGRPLSLTWSEVAVHEPSPGEVTLVSQATSGAVEIKSRTTIEYDGMILVDIEIVGESAALDGFSYEFTFPEEVARYYTHHLLYDVRTGQRRKDKLLEAAGLIPFELSLPFVPTLSVGNRTVGLEWWSESNANWSRSRTPLRLRRVGKDVNLRVEPVTRRVPVDDGWQHRFALFPAPMREAPKWRSTRFTFPSHAAVLDRGIGNKFFVVTFVKQFDSVWHGLPMSRKSLRQRELRERLRKLGVGYIPYAKLTVSPSLHPRTLENMDSWPATDRLYEYGPPAELEMVRARGWKGKTPYSYSVCMGREDYVQWILDESLKTFREEDTDGLYFDLGAIAEPCLKSPKITDRSTQQEWNYLAVRDFYKRLYTAMKREKPESLLVIHTPGQPKALAAWADFTFAGEALNLEFRDGRPWKAVQEDPSLYVPDYIGLPPGFLQALVLPFFGGASGLMPEVHPAADPDDPTRAVRFTREFFSVVLAEDIHVYLANSDNETRLNLLRAIDRFGGLEGASVSPHWENQSLIARDARIRVTAYTRKGRALMIVANWEDVKLRGPITLDLKGLDLEGAATLRDAEDWEKKGKPLDGGRFEIDVPPRDLRILVVE